MAETEKRTFTVPLTLQPDVRSDGKVLRLKGTAAVFDSPSSESLGFVEVLEPGAFTQSLRKGDQVLLWQHDTAQPLARRSAGNLRLVETARGLEFEAELPNTSLARDAVELVRSGVVKAMSFAFSMAGGRDRWEQRDGQRWRFIEQIGSLFEVSLVTEPAYQATSVAARQLVEARATSATRGRLRVKEREAYGPTSPHSFFRDLAAVRYAEAQTVRAQMAGLTRSDLLVELFSFRNEGGEQGGVEEARRRLATVEIRDITTAEPGAGTFVPASGSMPAYLGAEFAAAARAQATLSALLPNLPLPPSGMDVTVPRLDTGVAVAVQATEASAPTEADMDGGSQASKVSYITGKVETSVQVADRASPGFDTIVARDAGRALGAAVDAQLITGTNANGQTLGLITVTGIKTVTATDASPTAQEVIAKIWAAYDQIANGGYGVADLDQFAVVLHPRRLAFLYANAQGSQTVEPRLPGRIVPSAALRITLGAGTNEDEIFLLLPSELPYFSEPPRLTVDVQSMANTLQVRFIPLQPIATGFGRAPSAICRISGTALVAPSL